MQHKEICYSYCYSCCYFS